MPELPVKEGQVSWTTPTGESCTTWYKIVGDMDAASSPAPIVALHGGPGGGHEYLSPLNDLWLQDGIPIVAYDQCGCGRSTRFKDKMGDAVFWTPELFLKELDVLLAHLGLDSGSGKGYVIFGQSWGGMLGGLHAARRPAGLRKFINASGPASIPLFAEAANYLISFLDEDVQKTIKECIKNSDYESPEFEAVTGKFMAKFFCRMDPMPEDLQTAVGHLTSDPTAYVTMQGPSEFTAIGTLKDWDIGDDAQKIEVDTLLIHGEWDEAQLGCMEPWAKGRDNVTLVTLKDASHMCHWEKREEFIKACHDFLCA